MSADIELDHYARGFDRIGGKAFSRDVQPDEKSKYETLIQKGRDEADKRETCMKRAHEAYERGDGAAAKQLSNEGKRHAAKADHYFSQANDTIFRANNPESAPPDTIDLHGLFVAEAEKRVQARIRKDQQDGKTHLHVIVGKGIHSTNHVQKIKPAIEKLCQDLGLQYATEENEGRLYVNLQGDDVTHVPALPHDSGYHATHQSHQQQPHGHQYPGQQGQHYGGQNHGEQSYGGQNQQDNQDGDIEQLVTRLFKKYCCTVM
ncbi:hypothetical protein F5Y03DRAFT_344611 [Xylaria venustula]|nr:hypothetical protein F5Y03DRAFT_344611 [Xylaria venustula]